MLNQIPHKIVRSRRKSLTIEISKNAELIIRAPKFMPEFLINKFLSQKRSWIEKKIATATENKEFEKNYQFREGETFWYLGKSHSLQFIKIPKSKLIQDEINQTLSLSNTVTPTKVQSKLQKWYREQAREIITKRTEQHASLHDFNFAQIRITSAQKRWGSCNSKKNLNFSWRLVMAPMQIVDYVVCHELAHTKHLNHSKHFWHTVNQIHPEYKIHKKWLKENGHRFKIF